MYMNLYRLLLKQVHFNLEDPRVGNLIKILIQTLIICKLVIEQVNLISYGNY